MQYHNLKIWLHTCNSAVKKKKKKKSVNNHPQQNPVYTMDNNAVISNTAARTIISFLARHRASLLIHFGLFPMFLIISIICCFKNNHCNTLRAKNNTLVHNLRELQEKTKLVKMIFRIFKMIAVSWKLIIIQYSMTWVSCKKSAMLVKMIALPYKLRMIP